MKLTAPIKLLPTPEQQDALERTLRACNAACDYISAVAWEAGTFERSPLHKLVYYDVKERFGLGAQAAVRAIGKVVDAYKLDRKTKRTFSPLGATAFDARMLTYSLEAETVSIWTVEGRIVLAYTCGPRQRELLNGQRGESDLVYRDGNLYLYATCDVAEEPQPAVDSFLGVDLGIRNIAADSDGTTYSGGHVNNLRKRHHKLRQKLQAKGTKSAKRLLKKRRHKEQRFCKDVNHQIAKRLVAKAQGTARGIALEALTGIRERVTVRKSQRRAHHAWAFHDLRWKIEYKATLAGVPVVAVDPRNTSRICPSCSCGDKRNRPDQSTFCCIACGFSGHADTVAAVNIGRRAVVNQPDAAGLTA